MHDRDAVSVDLERDTLRDGVLDPDSLRDALSNEDIV